MSDSSNLQIPLTKSLTSDMMLGLKPTAPKSRTYRLSLPPHFRIYPVFHVSKLRPYKLSPSYFSRQQNDRPPPVINSNDQPTWEVEKIVNHRIITKNRKRILQYEVKWKNYPSSENTWELESNMKDNAPYALKDYLDSQ